ncbi:MAG TPA: 50S ribosomal protein L27 [bacterium]|nr:50S ribosomal protein L27 [bacterium]HOM26814.1 50S ribosomal protein L27 [bacterium]
MGRKRQGNGRDSNPKFRGTKVFDGQIVKAGNIIVRQKGSRILPGVGCSIGRDFTIYSLVDGIVEYTQRGDKKVVNVRTVQQ